ncbi:MAG TPA: RtcB family protein, partial [Candidatus Binatia bacterium]|nr:RtcB family protein [Candidatus Binatia bacterium]
MNAAIQPIGEATAIIPAPENRGKPITVVGTAAIRETFDDKCIEQALNSRGAPGVTDLVLNPDAHCGYGAPVGCVLVSPTHIYPGPVGVDIKCSMSFLQMDLPVEQIKERPVRRALIEALLKRTPTGPGKGQRSAPKARRVNPHLGKRVAVEGASTNVCESLGIPSEWANRCEDAFHVGHDEKRDDLEVRLDSLLKAGVFPKFEEKVQQLGSYGGGNHFGECEAVEIGNNERARSVAQAFGLRDGCVGFLSHCGSRGFGFQLAQNQFRTLQKKFEAWGTPLPGGDRELVYAPLGTPEADDYLDDMALGANFATVNHLLINALVLEAFQEV